MKRRPETKFQWFLRGTSKNHVLRACEQNMKLKFSSKVDDDWSGGDIPLFFVSSAYYFNLNFIFISCRIFKVDISYIKIRVNPEAFFLIRIESYFLTFLKF